MMAAKAYGYDGNQWNVAVGSVGNLTSVGRWLNTTGQWFFRSMTYDPYGNKTAEVDETGARTEWSYDPTYHILPIETRNALYFSQGDTRQNTTANYENGNFVCQKPWYTTDVDGLITWYAYDPHCRENYVGKPGGHWSVTYFWSEGIPGGNTRATYVNPPGGVSQVMRAQTHDGFGRPYYEFGTAPARNGGWLYSNWKVYAPRGSMYYQLAPFYQNETVYAVTYFAHDALNRLRQTTNPDGSIITSSYASGTALGNGRIAFNSSTVRDELGRDTITHKDAHGRIIETRRFLGSNGQAGGTANRMRLKWDTLDRLIEVTDEPGNQWTAAYDSMGRRTSVSDPNHGTWTFSYDAASRLTQQIDANGARSDFAYDGLGRMTGRAHYTSANVQTQWHAYKYDFAEPDRCPQGTGAANGGKLCRTEGHWGSTDVNHDANGFKVQSRWTLRSTTYTVNEARDAGGYLLFKTYSDGDNVGGATDPWTYDEAGRLKSIPGHATFFYNARGQVTAANYANGVSTVNTYNDQRGWLMRVVTSAGATALQDINYARAATGRIASVVSAGRPADSWTYTYDDLDRLLSATNSGNTALSQTFAYDSAHNMTSNSHVGAYSYPTQGLGAVRPHAVSVAGGYTLTYDAVGNMTSKTGSGVSNILTWDAENKLTKVVVGALHHNYSYDANHARVLKVVPQSGGVPDRVTIYAGEIEVDDTGTWTKYVHDDVISVATCCAA